ncbi:MAG: hypothetical protein HZB39_12900 [Planctomycetes bacterium]|nr:hypothetical protein [Planctomycetota bacterium]
MKTLVSSALPASLLLSALAQAQNLAVVPAAYASTDAPSRTVLVTHVPERTQVVIDVDHLQALAGRRIHAVLVRRDARLASPLAAGTWSVALRVGAAARSAADARPDYLANTVDPIEVFRGTLATPASPAPSGTPDWGGTNTVRIDFAQPFAYAGGGLVVDFESTPLGSDWWPIDAIDEPIEGRVTPIGSPCGRFASWSSTARAEAKELVVGRTATIGLHGDPNAPALLLFGTEILGSPLDMSVIGATGCSLHVLPFTALGTVVGAPTHTPEFGGRAWIDVHLPADQALLAATLALQWFEAQSTGFAFSEAIECELSAATPSLGMAIVAGQVAGSPSVRSHGVPVLGFVID